MPTLTSAQGTLNAQATPNDTISITVNSGAYSLEYPPGTLLANASTTNATYTLGAGTYRLQTTGSVTYTVTANPDSGNAEVSYDTNSGVLYANGSQVSGGGKPDADVIGDSIPLQGFATPNAAFGATTARGSYVDSNGNKQVGVIRVYPENPARLEFESAHGLATGARGYIDYTPSNYGLAGGRYPCAVLNSTQITLPGVDGTNLAFDSSQAASGKFLFQVDTSYGNAGWLGWLMFRLRNPFRSVGRLCRNGGSTAQVLAAYKANRPTTRKRLAIVHVARNDGDTFDQASHDELAALVLQDYELVRWVIPYQDVGSKATSGLLSKIKAIAAWARAKEVAEQRFRSIDAFGAFSDSTAAFEASIASLVSSDETHLQANGGRLLGYAAAAVLSEELLNPLSESIALASSSSNLVTGARFTGKTGTLGGIAFGKGDAPTSWQVGGTNRVSGGVCGIYAQVLSTPPRMYQPGMAVTKGQTFRIPGDPNWYAVRSITGDGKLSAVRPKATYDAAPLNDNIAVAPAQTLTLSQASTGSGVTATAGGAVFSASDVGKRIRNADFSDGHALITGYTSATVVTVTIDIAFAGTALASGAWLLETTMSNGGVGFNDGNATLYKIEPFSDSTQNLLWLWSDVQISKDDDNRWVDFFQNVALPGSLTAGVSQIQGQIYAALLSRFRWTTLRLRCLNGTTQIGASHGLGVNQALSNTPYLGPETGVIPAPPTDVPVGTTNLELVYRFSPGIEGGRFAVCLPVMEPVT